LTNETVVANVSDAVNDSGGLVTGEVVSESNLSSPGFLEKIVSFVKKALWA